MLLPQRSQTLHAPTQLSRFSIREAGAEFVRGTSRGWGRRELASWLLCQYAPCLATNAATATSRAENESAVSPTAIATTDKPPQLNEENIEQLVLDARSAVLRLLSDLAWPSQARAAADEAVLAGAVVKQRDDTSASNSVLWAPVGRGRMRLADRVASLFVADVLNAPADYRSFAFCRRCSELGFGSPIDHPTWCDRYNARPTSTTTQRAVLRPVLRPVHTG